MRTRSLNTPQSITSARDKTTASQSSDLDQDDDDHTPPPVNHKIDQIFEENFPNIWMRSWDCGADILPVVLPKGNVLIVWPVLFWYTAGGLAKRVYIRYTACLAKGGKPSLLAKVARYLDFPYIGCIDTYHSSMINFQDCQPNIRTFQKGVKNCIFDTLVQRFRSCSFNLDFLRHWRRSRLEGGVTLKKYQLELPITTKLFFVIICHLEGTPFGSYQSVIWICHDEA